jgi:competence protein ComEA
MNRFRRSIATGLAVALAFLVSTGVVAAAGKPAPAGKVNINTASVEQLATLPGIGPKLATRIVEYRQKSGGFKATQDLMNVKNNKTVYSSSYEIARARATSGLLS